MTQEALKLALEALEDAANAIESWGGYASEYFQKKHDLQADIGDTQKAITAIKEALAQPPLPVQEPVAWRRREVGGCWQYFGWEEAGMTYQCVERWNKNGFECEAIFAEEKNT